MKRSYFFPVALIVSGVLLLLNQFGLLFLSRALWIITFSLLIGSLLIFKAAGSEKKEGLASGSFFILFAGILILMKFGYIPIDDKLGFGLTALAFGFSEIMAYLVARRSFMSFVFGFIALLVAAPVLSSYYHLWTIWHMYDIISTYWPILLVALGVGFLVDGYQKKTAK